MQEESKAAEACPGCRQSLYWEVTVIWDDPGDVVRHDLAGMTRYDGGCHLELDWNGDVARAVRRNLTKVNRR